MNEIWWITIFYFVFLWQFEESSGILDLFGADETEVSYFINKSLKWSCFLSAKWECIFVVFYRWKMIKKMMFVLFNPLHVETKQKMNSNLRNYLLIVRVHWTQTQLKRYQIWWITLFYSVFSDSLKSVHISHIHPILMMIMELFY